MNDLGAESMYKRKFAGKTKLEDINSAVEDQNIVHEELDAF